MRVAIVDDERLAVQRLVQILECPDDVEVVGAFTKYTDQLHDFTCLRPDAVFLDIDMPGMNGLEFAAPLRI
ncbi:response regulator [Paenibacillus sp. FSL R7-0297]|uniref:LytR/AlgR family response regulator transcription factor n=1 Tax=Paenibacillus sp. FSL R7-0297 TaxID=2921680 RepID=UPI0030F84C9F